MKTKSLKEKQLWNKAVEETLSEMKKWDGIISDLRDRKYLSDQIAKKIKYKIA